MVKGSGAGRFTRSVAVLVVVTVGVFAATVGAAEAATVTGLTSEAFSGSTSTSSGWFLPSAGINNACLTAGSDTTQLPIKACSTTALDPSGSGMLRLTSNDNMQVGTVYNTTSLPAWQGLDVQFDSYQWNGSGADGISFVLAVTDPTNPAPPTVTAPLGGSLGYSPTQDRGLPGVEYGYLGFGLDVWGNFASSNFGGSDCPYTTPAVQSLTVRGPGNGMTGYCVLGTAPTNAPMDAPGATTRPVAVPVEIVVNPGAATTTASGLTVGANSWLMHVTPLGGTPQSLTGALPTAADLGTNNVPSSYYDASTGLPHQLTFGWAGGTGVFNEIHEINTLVSATLNGPLPSYQLALTDNQNGAFVAGNQAIVSVTPSLDAAQASETQPATVTTTFPAQITPGAPSTPDYTCSTTGQVVSCTTTASSWAAGSTLPELKIPVTLSSSAWDTYTISSKVSSNDGNPATASRNVTVTPFGAAVSAPSVPYGTSETLSVTGLPSSAMGTVAFTSGATALCTATLPSLSCNTATTLPLGAYPVTATYSGDGIYLTQTATTSFHVVTATSMAAAVSSPSVPYGSSDTLSVTGLPNDATGTVAFTSGAIPLCTATLPATSCGTASTLLAASYPVSAQYSGDDNYLDVSATTSFDVTQAATSITAGVASPTVAYGTAETLSFSGLPSGATATVTFSSGATTLCTATLPATSCSAPSTLAAGTYPVTATYSGDVNYIGSSATTTFTVDQLAAPGFFASATPVSTPYGTADTLAFGGVPTAASGTVTFTSGATTLCTATLPATSCSTSTSLALGTYPVTATYSGDANHAGAAATTSFTVDKAVTSITAAAASPAVTYGSSDSLAAIGVPSGATGTVTFTSGGNTLCTVTLPATSCSTPTTLAVGTYPVTATYSGDANYTGASATTSFTVTKITTTMTAAVSAPSLAYGSSDTLSVSGLPAAATGTVSFASGGNTLCVVMLPATACGTAPTLTPGSYPVTATYSGDATHTTRTATTSFTVTKQSTSIKAGVSSPSMSSGSSARLAVTGLPGGASGTVRFTSGARTLCTATLPATACRTSTTLPLGGYPVTAVYSGDSRHLPATATTAFSVTAVPVSAMSTTTQVDTSKTVSVPGSSGARSIVISQVPGHGAAWIVNSQLVYTPRAGFIGADLLVVGLVHADGSRSLVRVTVHVEPSAASRPPAAVLPFTGADLISPALLGTALLAAGTSILWTSRRAKRS
ncbi:MAG: hypothetical protein JWM02_3257 [Frankiales bacterium]|nr:hypothetical protein [Frankiales bacterium]